MDIKQLKKLAEEFGIPLIERKGICTLIGVEEFIEFRLNEFNTNGDKTMTDKKSPVGELVWLAVAKAVIDKKTDKPYYSTRLAFDVKKDADFLKWVSDINDAKVVTEKTYRGKSDEIKKILSQGKALVEAKSIYQPLVFDAAGNELEEAPMFFTESTGTAQMIVDSWTGEKGGTINLIGVIIHTIENPEGSTSGTDRETRLAQLREMAKPSS